MSAYMATIWSIKWCLRALRRSLKVGVTSSFAGVNSSEERYTRSTNSKPRNCSNEREREREREKG